ncbi:chemotaxis protein CheW [Synechocystis sp. PCC 7509]|uniref:chemotaxis protein CheW n=1 Tax=Synechocystis sp. PCC 7509 TaxID=927677 RepID=UPI0002ABB3C2|nr:chemotaxis protein CheW [Synechocystis sp. PCC 7509]
MKNTLVKSKSANLQQSSRSDRTASVKMIVFTIGSFALALPIEIVHKVLNQIPVYGSGLNGVGVAHVGDREVTVIDLHRQLFQSSIINETSQKGYLLILHSKSGELYGIPVASVPLLMDLPLSTIRVLPESYRNGDILQMATHVCYLPEEEPPLTIFLVNPEQMLQSSSKE